MQARYVRRRIPYNANMNISRMQVTFILALIIAPGSGSLYAQPAAERPASNAEAYAAFVKGHYAEAEAYYRKAVREAEMEGALVSVQATLQGNLAQVLTAQGKFREAEEFFKSALKLAEAPVADPRVRPILLVNLGALYRKTNRLGRAEALLEEALILSPKYFGTESAHMASVLKHLGILYAQMNRLKPAETHLKEALRLA